MTERGLDQIYTDYDKFYDAAGSVDGTTDTWDADALRGNFNQLRKLKRMYPNIKVLCSFGGWTWSGGFGTAPHSPLTAYRGIPTRGFNSDAAIDKLRRKGIPASKLLLGIGFYGRGWAGVTRSTPGGSATGAAPGAYEPGIEDYKVLKTRCPATGTVGGTAYAFCGDEWWSYDTPSTIRGKMTYATRRGLGGAFFWELSGDTTNGELITAMRDGLRR